MLSGSERDAGAFIARGRILLAGKFSQNSLLLRTLSLGSLSVTKTLCDQRHIYLRSPPIIIIIWAIKSVEYSPQDGMLDMYVGKAGRCPGEQVTRDSNCADAGASGCEGIQYHTI